MQLEEIEQKLAQISELLAMVARETAHQMKAKNVVPAYRTQQIDEANVFLAKADALHPDSGRSAREA